MFSVVAIFVAELLADPLGIAAAIDVCSKQ
jgi:hypothetical protein